LIQGRLALRRLDTEWQRLRSQLDTIFSPTIPPLERLLKYCEYSYQIQSEMKAEGGYVLVSALLDGQRVSTQRSRAKKIQQIFDQKHKYLNPQSVMLTQPGRFMPRSEAKARIPLSAYYK